MIMDQILWNWPSLDAKTEMTFQTMQITKIRPICISSLMSELWFETPTELLRQSAEKYSKKVSNFSQFLSRDVYLILIEEKMKALTIWFKIRVWLWFSFHYIWELWFDRWYEF